MNRLADLLPGVVAELAATHTATNGEPPMTDTTNELRHAEQQMLMARPWEVAEAWSIWEITGDYPNGRGTFRACLAVVLPEHITGGGQPLFNFIGTLDGVVAPPHITAARPLLLVDRDNPTEAYRVDDQVWLDQSANRT